MNGPNQVSLREQLQRPIGSRQRFAKDLAGRLRPQAIDGLLGHSGQPTKLAEAPIIHEGSSIGANCQRQSARAADNRRKTHRRFPAVLGQLFLPLAVTRQSIKRLKALVRRAPKEFLIRPQ
jgi:hypothetical protein